MRYLGAGSLLPRLESRRPWPPPLWFLVHFFVLWILAALYLDLCSRVRTLIVSALLPAYEK